MARILQLDSNARVLGASADIQTATRKLFQEKGARVMFKNPLPLTGFFPLLKRF